MLKFENIKKDKNSPFNKLYAPKLKFKIPIESPTPLSLNNSNTEKDFELECNSDQFLSYENINTYAICDNEIISNLCSLFVYFKGLFKE